MQTLNLCGKSEASWRSQPTASAELWRRPCAAKGVQWRFVVFSRRSSGGEGQKRDDSNNPRSRKGQSYEKSNRRRGRPAWTRNPDDSPLRDGNRDRLVGLLTERAARTLLYYLQEINLNIFYWLSAFMQAYPIPRDGAWDDVSGETFLRTLLNMPTQGAKFDVPGGGAMYDCVTGNGVDPRNLASRIMDIRSQLAAEFVQDLRNVAEENATLMRETISFSFSLDNVVDHPVSRAPPPAPNVVKKDTTPLKNFPGVPPKGGRPKGL